MGFCVFYSFKDEENVTVTHFVNVNKSDSYVIMQDLDNFEHYLIWIQARTSRGLGPKSEVVKARTLEKGESSDSY